MEKALQHLRTRRQFLRRTACAAVGTISVATTIRDLRFINAAVAQETAFNDYKALVCVFLSGGNDSNNLIIPTLPNEYSNYSAIRQNLALPASAVLPITSLNSDGHTYGLHPTCPELQTLFGEGKLAFVFNVGPLLYPLTRDQYKNNAIPKPPQLFSHADQVTHWQTSLPDQPPRTGWGGRIADLLHPQQLDLVNSNNSAKIALCTSIAGANTFEVGGTFQQYHVSTSGAVALTGTTGSTSNANRLTAMKDILAIPSAVLQRQAYANVLQGAIVTGDVLNAAIQNTSSPTFWSTPFPGSSLGNQLRMVARLIEARGPGALNMKRQIFFVSVGGYDTHTSQVANNGATEADRILGSHTNLLNEVSEALLAFQRATEQLGVGNNVTAFTASDFGRTFPTNGQGSDHGWGSHHLIMGGAVRGQRTYGAFPVQTINGPDDTSTGRWIPKVAVDQYAATLAKWFGVTNSDMTTIFPNIGRFPAPDLGFMA